MRAKPGALLASLCLVFLTAPSVRAAEIFTLKDALGVAYESNPQLGAQQAALRATDEDVARANGLWRPTVSADGSYGVEEFGFTPIAPNPITGSGTLSSLTQHPLRGQLTVTQPIVRGDTISEIKRTKALVRAGRAELVATEQTVLLNAVTSYMDVVRDTAILQLRAHDVEVLKKQRDATQLQFNVGALTRTDVAQSEARLAGAEADYATAEAQVAASRANFLQVIGRMPESLQDDPGMPPLPPTQDEVLTLALKQNPSIVSAEENERAADHAIGSAYGALLPQLSVQGQYQYSQGSFNTALGTGLGTGGGSANHTTAILGQLSVPIYDAGIDHAAVRQAKELHAQAELNVSVADRQVRDAVTSTWSALQAALSAITSNEATTKANEIAYEGVYKEQQVGGRTILDVLNAQQELLNAQVALVSSKRDAVVAAYQVLAAGGALTAKTLGLNVKFYDPQEHYDSDAARWVGFGD